MCPISVKCLQDIRRVSKKAKVPTGVITSHRLLYTPNQLPLQPVNPIFTKDQFLQEVKSETLCRPL